MYSQKFYLISNILAFWIEKNMRDFLDFVVIHLQNAVCNSLFIYQKSQKSTSTPMADTTCAPPVVSYGQMQCNLYWICDNLVYLPLWKAHVWLAFRYMSVTCVMETFKIRIPCLRNGVLTSLRRLLSRQNFH